MFPHLDLVVCPDIPLKDKVTYFSSLNLFHGANIDEKQIAVLKEKILQLIDSPLSRCDGLLLFEAALQQQTPFFFESWHKVILASLKASNNVCQDITYRILKLILRPSVSLRHQYNIEPYLSSIIDELITSNNSNSLATFECLSQCIRLHPAVDKSVMKNLDMFILKQLDTNSTYISDAIADCIIYLPKCTVIERGEKNISDKPHTTAQTLKKVLYTLQEILNNLINIDDDVHSSDEESTEKPEIYELPEAVDTEFSEIMMLARIFSTLSICAAKFLCQENTVFEVPLLWILKFIDRVFKLSESVKGCQSIERRELLLLVYPSVLKGTFTILEALVLNFGLIHQIENIISLLMNAIKATYIATFTGGTNCQMRYVTWRILNAWLRRNGTQISIEAGNTKALLRELFMDINPEITNEKPTVPVTTKRHHLPSKNKKSGIVFLESAETDNFNDNQIKTCNEALKVLYEFVNTVSPFQEEKCKDDIVYQIFGICHKIQKDAHTKRRFPLPYMNDKCRKNLYKIVLSLGISSDFNIKVQQQAFAILRVAQKDKSCKINLLSRRANSITRHMLQPKKKFPEAVTNNKSVFESAMVEDVCSGWENVVGWSGNHENHVADSHIEVAENNSSLSPETRMEENSMEENEIQNNFTSERECGASKFDRSLNSSRSDSDNESIMEQEVAEEENNQESNNTPYTKTILTNNIVKNEIPNEIDVSSEDENSSVEEEELEEFRALEEEEVEEEEEEEQNLNKAVVRADQNGLASTSEDEENIDIALTKNENREYSSEEVSGEEEETSREVINDLKHEIETLDEYERPVKKQKLNEDPIETLEDNEGLSKKLQSNEEPIEPLEENENSNVHQIVEDSVDVTESTGSEILNETAIVDDLNTVNEEIIENSCHPPEEESRTDKSPTFDEMCADLVLCESAQLADS